MKMAQHEAVHFPWTAEGGIATIALNRPEKKSPLTFDAFAAKQKPIFEGN